MMLVLLLVRRKEKKEEEDTGLDGDEMCEDETNIEEHVERRQRICWVKQEEETKEEINEDVKEQQKEEDKKNREDNCRKRKTN